MCVSDGAKSWIWIGGRGTIESFVDAAANRCDAPGYEYAARGAICSLKIDVKRKCEPLSLSRALCAQRNYNLNGSLVEFTRRLWWNSRKAKSQPFFALLSSIDLIRASLCLSKCLLKNRFYYFGKQKKKLKAPFGCLLGDK
jgi:hypothetical protein